MSEVCNKVATMQEPKERSKANEAVVIWSAVYTIQRAELNSAQSSFGQKQSRLQDPISAHTFW